MSAHINVHRGSDQRQSIENSVVSGKKLDRVVNELFDDDISNSH